MAVDDATAQRRPEGTRRLEGKVVVVTGAGRGQGAAEARRLVADGARVLASDLDAEPSDELSASLGDDLRYQKLDVSNEDDWRAALDVALDAFGSVTGLVNNAGISTPARSIVRTDPADYRKVIEVNQVGAFLGIHVVAPAIIEAGGGSIVNVSSVNGFDGAWGIAGYCSSKFGLRGLTRVAAIELAPKGIRVNSIHPGPIDTPMLADGVPPGMDAVEILGRVVPAGRVGTVDEIASMVSFLLSDESSYCIGSEFVVDGGYLAGPLGIPGAS